MQGFFSRRMGRGPYWLLVLLNSMAALLLIWTVGFAIRHLMVDGNGRANPVSYLWLMSPLVLALLHLPVLIGTIWRLHDTGHRSWPVWLLFLYPIGLMSLAYLAPSIVQTARIQGISGEQAITMLYSFYGIQLLLSAVMIRTIYLCCLRGDAGPNSYGPPPGGASVDDLPPPPEPETLSAPSRPATKAAAKPVISSKPSFGKRGA